MNFLQRWVLGCVVRRVTRHSKMNISNIQSDRALYSYAAFLNVFPKDAIAESTD